MLQYSTYSVISPEGCASILWKSAEKAPDAAEAMGITSDRIRELGLIDEIVQEPLGGAHRNPSLMAANLRDSVDRALGEIVELPLDDLLEQRYRRLMKFGVFRVNERA